MSDNNALGEALATVRRLWLHKKAKIKVGPKIILDIDHTIPGLVHDTIDALWPKEPKPLIIKKHKKETQSGWDFVIHRPPGICYRDFAAKLEYFHDATGGAVEIKKHGKAAIMTILTESLKNNYPYQWGPEYFKEDLHLPFPIGYSAGGFIVGDLSSYPNLLIAGMPDHGKSMLLRVILVSLLLHRDIRPVIIDLKQTEYEYFSDHAILAEDIPPAKEALEAINKEINRRLKILKKAKVTNNKELPEPMPWVVLAIDELAELHDKTCQELLNRIVRLGRAPGVCTIAATQRPSSTLFQKFGDSKAMFAATVCFKVRDGVNSRMLLDSDRAALIPEIPGRGIYQWDREIEVQGLNLPIKKARKLIASLEKSKNVGVGTHDTEPAKRLPPRQGDRPGGGNKSLPGH